MGEYGTYVWSSYALVLLGLVWLGTRAHQYWQRELKRAQRRLLAAQQNSEEQE